jgi:ribosomal protein S18 acetylase RimI-like enzyme
MNFEVIPAHEVPLAEQSAVFTDAFTGYVAGSFQMDAGKLAAFISSQGIDLCYSRFSRNREGSLVSFGYINRSANVSRLAGMGTVSAARRSGAALFLVNHLLDESKERGDEAFVLEVIEQNPAAVALYRSCGFRETAKLSGWRTTNGSIRKNDDAIREIPIGDALKLGSSLNYPELPWQISPYAAAKVVSARALALDNAAVVIGNPKISPARIHGYLGVDGTNWETLRRLTTGVLFNFPQTEFAAPPIFPEVFGSEIFAPLKFQAEVLSQFLMRKAL